MTIRFFLVSPAIPVLAVALALAAPPAAAGEDPAPAAPKAPAAEPEQGVAFEPGFPPYADVLAKAKAGQKLVFLDFFTEW